MIHIYDNDPFIVIGHDLYIINMVNDPFMIMRMMDDMAIMIIIII